MYGVVPHAEQGHSLSGGPHAALVRGQFTRNERVQRLTESGLQELSQGRADHSLVYLSAAYSAGGDSPAIRFLLRQARLDLPSVSTAQQGAEIFCACFNSNDTRVVTASRDATAKVFDPSTGKLIATLRHDGCVNSAAFSPDGKEVVTASDDGSARLWDAGATGQPTPLAILDHGVAKKNRVFPAVFSPDGRLIATASDDGTAKIWDAEKKMPTLLRIFTNHLARVQNADSGIDFLAFNSHGTLVVTAGKCDNTARVWDPITGHQISEMYVPGDDGLRYAAFSPDDQRVVTCSWTGEASLWETNGHRIKELIPPMGNLWTRRGVFSADGRQLVTASADGVARVFDGKSGELLFSLPHAFQADNADKKKIRAAAFSPDGRRIATAGGDGFVKIWEAAESGPSSSNERLAQSLVHGDNWVLDVEFSHDGRLLSSSGQDGFALVWNVAGSGEATSTRLIKNESSAPNADARIMARGGVLPGHARYVAMARFSRDAGLVVTIDAIGAARLWETATGKLLGLLDGHAPMTDAAFDLGGKRLITGGKDGSATIWSLASRTPQPEENFPAVFPGAVRGVRFVFNPDSICHRIAVAGEASVRILEMQGKAAALDLKGAALGFSSDGNHLLTLNPEDDKVAWLWTSDKSQPTATLAGDAAFVLADFDRDAQRIVTTDQKNSMVVWDAAGRRLFSRNDNPGCDLFFAAFSPDASRIVSVSSDDKARIWDARDGRLLATLQGGQKYLTSVELNYLRPSASFSPDSALVSTTSYEMQLNVWEVSSGRLLARLAGHAGNLSEAVFSPDGSFLLSGAQDGTARLWDVNYETNSPEAVASFVRQQVPWQLEGNKLLEKK